MARLPNPNSLSDNEVIVVSGPNGNSMSYRYNAETRELSNADCNQSSSCKHGDTHITEDPIPLATCLSPGLMSADDKCTIDNKLGMRLGVLGYMGSGSPDDGGYISGDTILAAGSNFISIERVGNVIRFNVDIPISLSCGSCDECSQLYLVQDETDVNAVRLPTCAGRLPGLNLYNGLNVHLLADRNSTTSTNIDDVLNTRGRVPSFIFKKLSTGDAFVEFVLKRDSTSFLSSVGWKFSPSTLTGTASNIYYMGKDTDGNVIDIEFSPVTDPTLLGSILYKGTSISKRLGIITDYTPNVLSDNNYKAKLFDPKTQSPVGDEFTVKNIWKMNNPNNGTTGQNARSLALDAEKSILEIGTVVDLVTIRLQGGQTTWYTTSKPELRTQDLWQHFSDTSFGGSLGSKNDSTSTGGSETKLLTGSEKNIEKNLWGISGLLPFRISADSTSGTGVGTGFVGEFLGDLTIDNSLPGLLYRSDGSGITQFVWSRLSTKNAVIKANVGKPTNTGITYVDFVVRSPIDSSDTSIGIIKTITPTSSSVLVEVKPIANTMFSEYGSVTSLTSNEKFVYETSYININAPDNIFLQGLESTTSLNVDDVIVSNNQNLDSAIIRLQFETIGSSVELTVLIGNYDTTLENFVETPQGSGIYSQAGRFTGVGTRPSTNMAGFIVYDGGAQIGGIEPEYWNTVEIMVRDSQIWIWWNQLLLVPSTGAAPYFTAPTEEIGKFGIKMVESMSLRSIGIDTQSRIFNEFEYGNLQVI